MYNPNTTRRPYERHNEASYHFKMSRYQQQLVDHIKAHPEFIQPESQRNLILSRLEEPLLDLSASRPVSSLQVRGVAWRGVACVRACRAMPVAP